MQISVARERYINWLSAVRDLSPHTIRAYRGDLIAFERHLGAGTAVAKIDRNALMAFVEQQRRAGMSGVSIKRRASALRGFCGWLRAMELLADDPTPEVSVPAVRVRQLPRVVPPPELERLLLVLRQGVGTGSRIDERIILANPHPATTLLAVSLMLATGVRVQEVVGICCTDIDISSSSLRLMGKGRREREVYLPNRWVALLTQCYIAARGLLGVRHDYLLFNCRLAPLTPAALRARLAKAADAAGVHRRITPHMLRHSAATQLIEAGVDIRYIQRLLGHASLSTTEIYTHVSDAALMRVLATADVLGRLGVGDN